MTPENNFIINERAYKVYLRSLQILENGLGLNIKTHNEAESLKNGQIFLFNHFARFETLVPPYIIFRATGAYSRSVADYHLFEISDPFFKFLSSAGAVPNNLPGLLPFLAAEILRGRKIVIFPEGSMVKDHRVLGPEDGYRFFSQATLAFRKQHLGAAVLALTLDLFKLRIKDLFAKRDRQRIEHWCEALGLENEDELLVRTNKPTLIIPSTITFSPVKLAENILSKGIELFRKNLPSSVAEELAVEGSLLFHNTDMDIRFGKAINTEESQLWHWWHDILLKRYFGTITSLPQLFGMRQQTHGWCEHLLSRAIQKGSRRIRNTYMARIYTGVTVNLGHLVSVMILTWVKRKRMEIPAYEFHKVLYLAIKNLQKKEDVYVHRGIDIPDSYRDLLVGENKALADFLKTCEQAGLVSVKKSAYQFLEKLSQEPGIDAIRLENPVLLLSNEVGPLPQVQQVVNMAIEAVQQEDESEFAKALFDDEQRSFRWHCQRFSHKQFQEINKKESATNTGEPFLLGGVQPNRTGVLLVHGFLASPAELYTFGQQLAGEGHRVLGIRLAGHGTSPWDLQERHWQEWLNSVRRGYRILATICDEITLVGFSAGGGLGILLAAEQPEKLTGVACVATPLAVKDHTIHFVPMVHFLNKLMRHIPGVEGVRPFYNHVSDYPETNYSSVPFSALKEFRTLMKDIKSCLSAINIPVLVMQGDADPVIDETSAQTIFDTLQTKSKTLHFIPSKRHGLIYENIGQTWSLLAGFIQQTPGLANYQGAKMLTCEKEYPAGLAWNLTAVDKPVASIFEEAVASAPAQPALFFMGRTYLYREVDDLVKRLTAGLQAHNIKKGERVGLCLPNSPYFVVAYYAALKAGATVVNFNPLYTAEEIAAQIEDSGVSLMFTLDLAPLYNKVAASLAKTSLKRVVVCSLAKALPLGKSILFRMVKWRQIVSPPEDEQHLTFERLLRHGATPKDVQINPETDTAILQYTGGTTGVPKAAKLSHSNVSTNTEQVRRWLGEIDPKGERFLAVLPFFHVFAMTAVLNLGIATAGELILLPRFELKKLLKMITDKKPTIFFGVPTIFAAINNFPGIERYNLSSIRYCISGGAPLPAKVKSRFESLTGCVLVEGYGLSETSPVLTCNPLHCGGRPNSIGLPLPGTEIEVRDLEDLSKKVDVDQRGEICVRGPQVMAGYWQRPQEDKDAFVDDWFRTGDVGHMDRDGYFFITDRLKEIIIVSGYNVYPRIIEDAIYQHPDVEEVVVIGISDEYKGEVPKAFVKLKKGATVTEEDIIHFSSEHLNPIEHVVALEFRKELPKTLIGKHSKKELKAEEIKKLGNR